MSIGCKTADSIERLPALVLSCSPLLNDSYKNSDICDKVAE